MKTVTVKLLDFTKIPGGRFRIHGKGSAEAFYEEHLLDILNTNPDKLIIDFTGTWGAGPSFISQLTIYLQGFYGNKSVVKQRVTPVATGNPQVINDFWEKLEELS